ncbi:MAG: CapA family protein [Eubacteriales bacterium]|nr:CapA family protein [Eubacteriales bacterium]
MTKKGTVIAVISLLLVLVFVAVTLMGLNKKPETPPKNETTPPTRAETTVPPEPEEIVLSFIGDCIIGSESGIARNENFSWYADNVEHEYFFEKVRDELSQDDLTFSNVECVITDRDLDKIGKDYSPAFWFKTPTKNVDILTLGSVEVAGITNNHTSDYGAEGYEDTKKALEEAGIPAGEDCVPMYFDVKGLRIGVVYAHLWADYHLSYVEDALSDMEGQCDYKIVFFHGGEEGIHEPDDYKIKCARKLAEEGQCDLIVGSHPHVLQPMEVVNGVPIVYSLGNFCYSASIFPENKTVIFRVRLTRTEGRINTETEIIPCYVYTGSENNYQPTIVTDKEDYDEIIGMMNTPVRYSYEQN